MVDFIGFHPLDKAIHAKIGLIISCDFLIPNFTRVPKSPHLLFYKFSMNYYEFPKFSKFPTKRSSTTLFIRVIDFAVRPFHFVKFEPKAPGRNLEQRSMPGLLLPAEGACLAFEPCFDPFRNRIMTWSFNKVCYNQTFIQLSFLVKPHI